MAARRSHQTALPRQSPAQMPVQAPPRSAPQVGQQRGATRTIAAASARDGAQPPTPSRRPRRSRQRSEASTRPSKLRRRPTPVNTSSRRTGSDLSKSSVSDMYPTPRLTRADNHPSGDGREAGVKTPLTLQTEPSDLKYLAILAPRWGPDRRRSGPHHCPEFPRNINAIWRNLTGSDFCAYSQPVCALAPAAPQSRNAPPDLDRCD